MLAAAMPTDMRGPFVAVPERARVLAGNHIAFGLPKQVRRPTGPLMPPGFRGSGPLM